MKKLYIISFIFVIIDRVIKILIQNFVDEDIVIIKNFFYITNVKNVGAAFSILEGMSFLFVIIGIIATIFIIYYLTKHKSHNIGLYLMLSGIIGNLIDRIIYSYVIDYIGFILFKNYMPIFNFADTLIVLGAALLILGSGKHENYL